MHYALCTMHSAHFALPTMYYALPTMHSGPERRASDVERHAPWLPSNHRRAAGAVYPLQVQTEQTTSTTSTPSTTTTTTTTTTRPNGAAPAHLVTPHHTTSSAPRRKPRTHRVHIEHRIVPHNENICATGSDWPLGTPQHHQHHEGHHPLQQRLCCPCHNYLLLVPWGGKAQSLIFIQIHIGILFSLNIRKTNIYPLFSLVRLPP